MINSFEIAVIGAGPAGAITAICLARLGRRVGLFESTAFDQDRFGETLPPEVNPVLRNLSLWDGFLSQSPLQSPGIVSTWGSPNPSEVDFVDNPFGCGWHVDRNQFDRFLCEEAVAVGASLFRKSSPKWAQHNGMWHSDGVQANGVHAKFLVNATGRNGALSGHCSSRVREDVLLAVVMRLAGAESQDQRTFVEAAPAGWWYSTLLPDRSGLAMFFTGAEVYREQGISLQEQLHGTPMTRTRLNTARITSSRIVSTPTGHSTALAGANWAAVGDSASAYDPLSGRGIFKALRHGEVAAHAIHSMLSGNGNAMQAYTAQVLREFQTYSIQRRYYYALEQRWPHHPFWTARHSGI